MNCRDVVTYVVEPGIPQEAVREHLETCGACRALVHESRRVADVVATLPATPSSDIAAAVMNRIGYGNGRPTRDKIVAQLTAIRAELDEVLADVEADEVDWRPTSGEPSVAELAAHLPGVESSLVASAESSLRSGNGFMSVVPMPAGAKKRNGAGHAHITTNGGGSAEDLRRVRERTLQLVSGLGAAELDHTSSEELRTIYRHEADHAAQIRDTLWRHRRRRELGSSDT